MSILSEIDPERHVIIRRAHGEICAKDIIDAIESTYALPGFRPGMGAVWDYSDGTVEQLKDPDHKLIADFIKQQYDRRGIDYRIAFFAPRDIDFGISRLYEIIAEMTGLQMQTYVFRDFEQAIQWASDGSILDLTTEDSPLITTYLPGQPQKIVSG